MNTMELLGFNSDGSDRKEPAEIILDAVEEMHKTAQQQHKQTLGLPRSLHEIGYIKGKVQAFHEVLEFLRTGKIPEEE